jgi:glutathione S-transferase
MFPVAEPARRRALKVATLGVHTAEKAVSLFYEKVLHRQASDVWTQRCCTQISGALAALEPDRAARKTDYWFGDSIGHADIAVAAALRFIGDAHPGVVSMADYPALSAHSKRCEALPVFQSISQKFIPPA